MSSSSYSRYSRYLPLSSNPYNVLDNEMEPDAHEMQDMKRPPGVASAGVSVRSITAPLLQTSKASDTSSNNHRACVSSETQTEKARYFQGWRMGVTLCALTAATVLTVNVVLTIIASIKYGLHAGFGTLRDGSCRTTRNLNLWLHLAINVLSTLLLGASNYCMQCLASPTREEIDKAHNQQVWLDIGILSVRNLSRIAPSRLVLWCLLAASTIPLHLLWNGAVFATLLSNDYFVFIASPEFIGIDGFDWSASVPGTCATDPYLENNNYTMQNYRDLSEWERLDNDACIQAYAQDYVSAHGDVIAVTSNMNSTVPILCFAHSAEYIQSYSWICSNHSTAGNDKTNPCNVPTDPQNSANWTLLDPYTNSEYKVQYCLSQPVEEHCKLQFSIVVMCIVITCNLVKVPCMLLMLRFQRSQPLVTLGDAITSFLRKPDLSTEGFCLAEKDWFSRKSWGKGPTAWKNKRHHWFSSASKKRWLTCNTLCIGALVAAVCYLRYGLYVDVMRDHSLTQLWQTGFGSVTSDSIIPLGVGPISAIFLVNSPQIVLSFLFLTYNSLLTCMLLSSEWNGYAYERKSLRVTNPTGTQRSTYRLQLPYKYGIPLLIISGTMHWLVSQSIFLARIDKDSVDGRETPFYSVGSDMGYSRLAFVTTLFLGSVVIILGILNGFRKYEPGIPLVGSCSATISAACHRLKEDEDAANNPLMWGVVTMKDGVGHCCFTSFEVTTPIEDELYAGFDTGKGSSTLCE